MTREKAIRHFERYINDDCYTIEHREACRMAVIALREQEERENRKPLTLDELRQMDGEPVWIDDWFEDFHGWELSKDASDYFDGDSRTVESYGTRWEAYRSKPKEDAR